MRRSDHPSRPSAITCSRFSALKTLAIPAAGGKPTAQVNVSAPGAALAGFQVSINGRFWVSTEADGARGARRPGGAGRTGWARQTGIAGRSRWTRRARGTERAHGSRRAGRSRRSTRSRIFTGVPCHLVCDEQLRRRVVAFLAGERRRTAARGRERYPLVGICQANPSARQRRDVPLAVVVYLGAIVR